MTSTRDLIKEPLAEWARSRPELHVPDDGPVREYPLSVGEKASRFKADWAFRLAAGAYVFIEDDDAVRALHNVTKYWMWIENRGVDDPVHLIHLVGPGARDLVRFEGKKAMEARSNFHHVVIEVDSWSDRTWLARLAEEFDKIIGPPGPESAAKGKLRDDAAIGMWRDRADMPDGAAWVRGLRDGEWIRS